MLGQSQQFVCIINNIAMNNILLHVILTCFLYSFVPGASQSIMFLLLYIIEGETGSKAGGCGVVK